MTNRMPQKTTKKTTSGIRLILYIASFLVLSVSISLYFLPAQTERYFSWTINPPLTAAFLGAGYLTSFILEFLSARETIWARARTAIPAVWLFTFLTLIVTLIHIDRFHFNSPTFITVLGTWVWLAVYVSVPIAMGILWIYQIREPGADPERIAPLPKWLSSILIIQGGFMLLLGCAMLLFPDGVIPLWPWKLSPLTSRAIGAWGIGVGVIALQAAWENDWSRLYPMMLSYALYGLLQIVNLFRFSATINWEIGSAFFYIFFVVTILLVGLYGVWQTRPYSASIDKE